MAVDPNLVLDHETLQDPYRFYDELRETAPVWQAGEAPIYLITAFEPLAEAALRIEDFSSEMKTLLYRNEYGRLAALPVDLGKPTMSIADPPTHTQHKQFMFPKFVAKRMASLEPEISAKVAACIAQMERMDRFDFMAEMGGPVPIFAISGLLGVRRDNDRELLQTAYDASEMVGGTMTLTDLFESRDRSAKVGHWLNEQLAQRDGASGEDVLDALKGAVLAGIFDEGQATTTMITLLSAGAESTASLLGNAVRILAEQPELRMRLQQDLSLLPNFIEEAARIESPFRHHLRSVPRDTELAGVAIPAGATVLLMWGAANRDPAQFEAPDQIRLDRQQQHLTFGRGIHLCVGRALAKMEAGIVLGAMLRRDRFPELCPDDRPVWEDSLMVRRHRTLPMRWS